MVLVIPGSLNLTGLHCNKAVDRTFYDAINYSRSVGDTLAKIQHKNRESRAEKECKLVFHTVHTYS